MWNRLGQLAHSVQGSLQPSEDGAAGPVGKLSVAHLEEQLIDAENRNKMINEEFKKLLKEKQREIDHLKRTLEESGHSIDDSIVSHDGPLSSTLNESALSRKVEEYEMLLQQKDDSLQLLTAELHEVENHKTLIEEQERKNTEKLMHELAGRIEAHEKINRRLEEMKHVLEEKDIAVRNMADQLGAQDELLKGKDESIKKLKRMAAGSEATEEMIVTLQKSIHDKDAKASAMLEQIDRLETENKILSGKVSNREELGSSKDETIDDLYKEIHKKDELLRRALEEKRNMDVLLMEKEDEIRKVQKTLERKELEIDDLNTKIEKCENEIHEFQATIESMNIQHSKTIQELRDCLTESSELLRSRSEALNVLQQADQDKEATINRMNEKIQELTDQVDSVGSTLTLELESEVSKRETMEEQNRIEHQLDQTEGLLNLEREKLKQVKEQYSQLQQFHDQKRREFEELTNIYKDELGNSRQHIGQLEDEKAKLYNEISDLESLLEQFKADLSQKTDEVNQVQETVISLEKEVEISNRAKDEVTELLKEKEELIQKHAAEINDVNEKLGEELQKAVNKHEEDMTKARKVMKKLKTAVTEKGKEVETLTKQLEDAMIRETSKDTEIENLKTQFLELEKTANAYTTDLKTLQLEKSKRDEELTEFQQSYSALQDDKEALSSTFSKEKEVLCNNISHLQLSLDSVRQEKEETEASLNDFKQRLVENQELNKNRVSELENILASKNQDVSQVIELKDQELKDTKAEITRYKHLTEEKDGEIQALKDSVSCAANEIQELFDAKGHSDALLITKVEEVTDLTKQLKELTSEYQNVLEKIQVYEKDLLDIGEKETSLGRQAISQQKELEQLKEVIRHLESELSASQASSQLFQEQLDEEKEISLKFKEDLNLSLQEEERFKNVAVSLEENLNEKENDLNQLKNNLSVMTEELENYTEKLDTANQLLLERDELVRALKDRELTLEEEREKQGEEVNAQCEKYTMLVEKVDVLKIDLTSKNAEVDELAKEVLLQKEKLDETNVQLTETDQQNRVLNESFQALSTRVADLTEQLDNTKRKLEAKENELLENNSQLSDFQRESNDELRMLNESIKGLEEEKRDELKKRDDLVASMELELKTATEKYGILAEEVDRFRNVVTSEQSQNHSLRLENQTLETEKEKLEEELQKLTSLWPEGGVPVQSSEVEILSQKLYETEKKVRDLEITLTDGGKNDEESTLGELRKELESRELSLVEKNSDLELYLDAVCNLEALLGFRESQSGSVAARLQSLGTGLKDILTDAHNKELAFESIAEEIEHLKMQNLQQVLANEALASKLEEVSNENSKLAEIVACQNSSLTDLQLVEKAQQENDNTREKERIERDNLTQDNRELSQAIEKSLVELDVKDKELQNLRQNLEIVDDERSSLQQELSAKLEEIQTVRSAFNTFKLKTKRKLRSLGDELTTEKNIVAEKIKLEEDIYCKTKELKEENNSMSIEMAKLENQKMALENTVAEKTVLLAEREEIIHRLSADLDHYECDNCIAVDDIKAALELKTEKITVLQDELIRHEEELCQLSNNKELAVASLEGRLSEMEVSLSSMCIDNESLREERKALGLEKEDLIFELAQANVTIRELSLFKEEGDKLQNTLNDTMDTLRKLEQEKEDLKGKLSKVVKKAQGMKKDLALKERLIEELNRTSQVESVDKNSIQAALPEHSEVMEPVKEITLNATNESAVEERPSEVLDRGSDAQNIDDVCTNSSPSPCNDKGKVDDLQADSPSSTFEDKKFLEDTIAEKVRLLREKENYIKELENSLEELRVRGTELNSGANGSLLSANDASTASLDEGGNTDSPTEEDPTNVIKKYQRLSDNFQKLKKRMVLMKKAESKLGQENKELENSIRILKKSNEELSVVNKKREEEIDQIRRNEVQLNNKNVEFKSLIESLENERATLDKDLKAIAEEIEDVKSLKEGLLVELDCSKEKIASLASDYVNEQNTTMKLSLENEKLMDAFIDLNEERSRMKKEMETVEGSLSIKENSISKLVDEVNEIRSEAEEKDQKIALLKNELQELNIAFSGKDNECSQLRSELWFLKEESTALNDQLKHRDDTLEQVSKNITSISDDKQREEDLRCKLEKDLEKAESKVVSLEEEKSILEVKLAKLQNNENKPTFPQEHDHEHVEKSHDQKDDSVTVSPNNSLLDVSVTNDSNESQTLESVKQHKDIVIGKLKLKLKQTIKGNKAVKEDLEAKMKALRKENEDLNNALNFREQQRVVDTEDAACITDVDVFEDLSLLHATKNSLEVQLEELKNKNEELISALNQREDQKVVTMHDEASSTENDEFENCNMLQEALSDLTGKYEQIKVALEVAYEEKAMLSDTNAEMSNKIIALEDTLKKNQEEFEDIKQSLSQDIRTLQQHINDKDMEVSSRYVTLEKHEYELNEKNENVVAFEKEVSLLSNRISELEDTLAVKGNELERNLSHVRDLTSEMENARNEAISLANELWQEKEEKENSFRELTGQLKQKDEACSELKATVEKLRASLNAPETDVANKLFELNTSGTDGEEFAKVKSGQAVGTLELCQTSTETSFLDKSLPEIKVEKEIVHEDLVQQVAVEGVQSGSVGGAVADKTMAEEIERVKEELQILKKQKDTTIAKIKLKLKHVLKEKEMLNEKLRTEKQLSEDKCLTAQQKYEESMYQLQEENASLQNRVRQAEVSAENTCKEIESFQRRLGSKENELQTENNRNVELLNEIGELKYDRERLQNMYKKMEEEKNSLEELKLVLEETIEVNERHVATLQLSNTELSKKVDAAQKELNEELKSKEKIMTDINLKEEEVITFKHLNESLQKEIEKLNLLLEEESERVEQYLKSGNEHQTLVNGLHETLENKKQEAIDLNVTHQKEIEAMQKREREIQAELKFLQQTNELLQREKEELKLHLEKEGEKMTRFLEQEGEHNVAQTNMQENLNHKKEEVTRLIKALEKEVDEKMKMKGELDILSACNDDLTSANENLASNLSTMQNIMSDMSTLFGTTDIKAITDLTSQLKKNQEVAELRANQLMTDVTALEKEKEKAERTLSEVEAARTAQNDSYKTQLKEMSLTMLEAEDYIKNMENELLETKQLLLKAENDVLKFEDMGVGQDKRIAGLLQEMKVKEDNMKDLHIRCEYERHRNTLLLQEMESFKNVAMPEMESTISAKNKDILELRNNFEGIMTEKETVVDSLRAKMVSLENEKERLEKSLQDGQNSHTKDFSNLTKENSGLKEKILQLEERCKTFEEEDALLGSLKTELKFLQDENQSLKKSLEDTHSELTGIIDIKTKESTDLKEKVVELGNRRSSLERQVRNVFEERERIGSSYLKEFDDISHGLRGDVELAIKERREIEMAFELDRLNLERQREEKIQEVKRLKSHIAENSKRLQEKNKVISELQLRLEKVAEMASKEDYYLGLEEELERERRKREDLAEKIRIGEEATQKSLDANNDLQYRLNAVSSEKDILILQFESKLQKNLAEHTAYCERLRVEFEAANGEKDAMVKNQNETISTLEAKNEACENSRMEEVAHVRVSFEERQALLTQNIEKLEKERLQLRQDILHEMQNNNEDVAQKMRKEYDQIIQEKDEKIDDLFEQFTESRQLLYAAQDENLEVRNEARELKVEIKNALNMVDTVNREKEKMLLQQTEEIGNILKAKGKEFKELREQFEDTMTSKDEVIEQQRGVLRNAGDERDSLKTELDLLKKEHGDLVEEVEGIRLKGEELQSLFTSSEAKISVLIDEIKSKDEDIAELCIKVEEGENEAAFFKKQLQEKCLEIDDLSSQFKEKVIEMKSGGNIADIAIDSRKEMIEEELVAKEDFFMEKSAFDEGTRVEGSTEVLGEIPVSAEGVKEENSVDILDRQMSESHPAYGLKAVNVDVLSKPEPEITSAPLNLGENVSVSDTDDVKTITGYLESILGGLLSKTLPHLSNGNLYDKEENDRKRKEYNDIVKLIREAVQNCIRENQRLQLELVDTSASKVSFPEPVSQPGVQSDAQLIANTTGIWSDSSVTDEELKVEKCNYHLPEVVADTLQGQKLKDPLQNNASESENDIEFNERKNLHEISNVVSTSESEIVSLKNQVVDQKKVNLKLKQVLKQYKSERIHLKTRIEQETENARTVKHTLEEELNLLLTEKTRKDQELQSLREEVAVLVEEKQALIVLHKSEVLKTKSAAQEVFDNKVESLMLDLQKNQQIINSLEETKVKLNNIVEDQASTLQQYKRDIAEAEIEQQLCRDNLDESNKRAEELQALLNKAEILIAEKIAGLDKLDRELEELKKSVIPKVTHDVGINNAAFDVEVTKSLQNTIMEKTNRIRDLDEKLIVFVEEKRREEESFEAEIKSYQDAILSLKSCVQTAKQEKLDTEKEMQKLRSEMEELCNDRDSIAQIWKERLKELQIEKEAEASCLESEYRQLLSGRETELWDAQGRIENLVSDQLRLNEELSLVKYQLTSLQEQNTKLHEVNNEGMIEFQKIVSEKKEIENRLFESKEIINMSALELETNMAKHALDVKALQDEVSMLALTVDETKLQLDSKSADCGKLEHDNQRKAEGIRKLKKEILSLRNQKQRLEDDVSSEFSLLASQLQQENEHLRTSCITKDKELRECRMYLEQSVQETSYLQDLVKRTAKLELETLNTSVHTTAETTCQDAPGSRSETVTNESRTVVNTPEEEQLRFQLSKLHSEAKTHEAITEESMNKLKVELQDAYEAKRCAEIEAAHLRAVLKNRSQPRRTEKVKEDVVRLKGTVDTVKSDLEELRSDAATICKGFQLALQETTNTALQLLQKPQDAALDTTDYRPLEDVSSLSFIDDRKALGQEKITELEQTVEMWKNRCAELEDEVEKISSSDWGRSRIGEDSFLLNMEDIDKTLDKNPADGNYHQRLKEYRKSGQRRFRIPVPTFFSRRRGLRGFPPLRRSATIIYAVLLHAMALWAIYCSVNS